MKSQSWSPSPRLALFLVLATLALALPALVPPASAQAPGESPEPVGEALVEPFEVPPERASPQATMRTFLESFYLSSAELQGATPLERAAACLDLSAVPERLRDARGAELAAQLKAVLDRTERIDVEAISDDPDGEPFRLEVPGGGVVEITRTDEGEWLFSERTVATLPELYRSVEELEVVEGIEVEAPRTVSMLLRSLVPERLRQRGFLLEHWQWLALLALIFLGVVLDKVVSFLVERAISRQLGQRLDHLESGELSAALRPVGLLAAALLWWLGVLRLDLPTGVLDVLVIAARFVAATALVWAFYRTVDIVAAVLEHRAARTASKFDDLLIPLVRKSLKLFVFAFGLVFIADTMDVEVASLLAGLGIGGIAVALAAQDMVKNLFGSLMVVLDRPFHVGDWVLVGEVEGTVEEVGFRSTRIRTFYNSLITLPNANLINTAVDNYGARRYRRWTTHLSLPYATPPDKVEAFCEGVRELIRRHPYTRKDYYHVYLNKLSAASIDVLLYMFFEAPNWDTELRERHRLALDILRLGAELGVDFAFPTQTLYLHRPGEPPQTPGAEGYDEMVSSAHEEGREKARALVDGALKGQVPPPL